ncbi:MAG TPA: biotin transporter BioY [Candidatus Methanoperedens sp.]|nr:biotin transporter BioY [Candidatus Methanoperedens sp.]
MLQPATRVHKAVLVALFAVLTAVGAFIRVPLPGVPFTLQVPAVLLAGVALGPWLGAASQLAYIAVGLLGLPVFAAGGGPAYLLTPTFGFLVGFVAAALATGVIAGDPARSGLPRLSVALLAGIVAIYLVGVPWFSANLALYQKQEVPTAILWKFASLYLPLDLVKAALLLPVVRVIRRRGGLLARA